MACFCMIIMVWSYNSTHSDMSDVDQGLWCGLITLPIQTCQMWIKDYGVVL
jgi:hypothetical protein